MTAISCVDLCKTFRQGEEVITGLDQVTLGIESGEFVCLSGPSGSGKTTLLNAMGGLDTPNSGQITVGAHRLDTLSKGELADMRLNNIGFVFQAYNLVPVLSARENVAAPLMIAGATRRAALERADELLDEVGMADRANHRPNQLSGGQQQRVAVARGLVADPPLLLADEPTANLDLISAEAVISLLRRLRASGRTIIISTHDNRLLPAIDRIVEMAPMDERDDADAPAEVTLTAGETLFRQGDLSDYVYEIHGGTIEVVRELTDGSEELLATLTVGNYVGELGPLLGFPRSATVRAGSDAKLRPMTVQDFKLQGLEQATKRSG